MSLHPDNCGPNRTSPEAHREHIASYGYPRPSVWFQNAMRKIHLTKTAAEKAELAEQNHKAKLHAEFLASLPKPAHLSGMAQLRANSIAKQFANR